MVEYPDLDGFNLQKYFNSGEIGWDHLLKLDLFLSQDTGRTPACHSSMTDLRPFRFKVCVYDHIIDVSDSSDTAYTNYVCIIYIYIIYFILYWCVYYLLVLLFKQNELKMSVGENAIAKAPLVVAYCFIHWPGDAKPCKTCCAKTRNCCK